MLLVCKDPILPTPSPKPPDMPINMIIPAYQQPQIEDEAIDVEAIEPEPSTDFAENAPQQEGIIHQVYGIPGNGYLQESPELHTQVNSKNLVQGYLYKQADLQKILKIIQRKVLKGTFYSVAVKEIQAGYLISVYFKDVDMYIAHNKLPPHKAAIRSTETLAERYLLLDSLLFRPNTTPGIELAVLAIPDSCIDRIITLYHSRFYRSSRCHYNVFNYQWKFFHTRSNTLS